MHSCLSARLDPDLYKTRISNDNDADVKNQKVDFSLVKDDPPTFKAAGAVNDKDDL